MEDNVCEYCKPNGGYFGNIGVSALTRIVITNPFERNATPNYALQVGMNFIDINNCPMCGRELK